MPSPLHKVIAQNRSGQNAAIVSVCTAHEQVIRASLLRARDTNTSIVIEATSNQVNQYGGYAGMTAGDFVEFVNGIADAANVGKAAYSFGGDHLGPQAWRSEPAKQAMAKAEILVGDYVRAGINKIHLDCSEGCAGEPAQLVDEVTAERAAHLARICIEAADDPNELLFVIGTEVPPPGGARVDEDGHIAPTKPASAQATIAAHRKAFEAQGIGGFWHLVGGLVVQPGVEFSPMQVHRLPSDTNTDLRQVMMSHDGLCLEAHSTDYQSDDVYPRLAELGFAFQKVGPALTFAWRRALYSLDHIRSILGHDGPSLVDEVETVMCAEPANWQGHYHSEKLRAQRHFGYADRVRYYWPHPTLSQAVERLFDDLPDKCLSEPIIMQGFEPGIARLADAIDAPRARALALASVQAALDPYLFWGER